MDWETKKQIAAWLQVTPRTVENKMAEGLPHMKMSKRCVRFNRIDVEAWLNRKFATSRTGKLVSYVGKKRAGTATA